MKISEQSKSQGNQAAGPCQTHRPNKLISLRRWRCALVIMAAAFGLAISTSGLAQQLINVDYIDNAVGRGPTAGSVGVFTGQGVLGGPSDTYWNGYYDTNTTTTNGLSGLLDSAGNSTGVGITMTAGGSSWSDTSGTTGTGALLADYYYCSPSNTVTLTGLDTNSTYTLISYCSGNVSGQGGAFSGALSGTSTGSTRTSFVLNGNYVENNFVSPDANGTVTFSIGLSGGYAIFNGLQIQKNFVDIHAPVITNQPAGQTVRPGQTATFTVGASLGSQAPYYQWYFGGNPIAGATKATLTITNASVGQAGSYTVVVTNMSGSATSAPPAVLTLDSTTTTSIVIGGDLGQGLDLQGTHYEVAEYYSPSDSGPLAVQNAMFTNDTSLFTSAVVPGYGNVAPNFGADLNDTNLSLMANNYAQSDSTYDPLTLAIPTVLGENYKLQLIFHDPYSTGPSRQQLAVTIGSEVVEPALDVVGLGAGNSSPNCVVISYFFTGDGNSLPITISNILSTGFAEINALTLQVLPGAAQTPYFVTSPLSQTNVQGSTVSFSALAGGSIPPFSYQWYFGTNVIAGATGTVFSIPNVLLTNAGTYYIVASNGAGAVTNSAILSVNNNVNLILSTGPAPGQGMNLQGNNVLAEYYDGAAAGLQNLLVGSALFVPSTRASAGSGFTGGVPNFGPTLDQQNLSFISTRSVTTTNFNFPTTAGINYNLQLILHDGFWTTAGSRVFGIQAVSSLGITNVLAANLDLAANGAFTTNARNVVISFVFTGDGGPMNLNLAATANSPCISALVLQDLTSAVAPAFLAPLPTQGAYLGDTVTFNSRVNGAGIAYQWQQQSNGVYNNILGATNYSLTITNIGIASATNYVLVATNFAGSASSTGVVQLLAFNPHNLIGHWLAGSQSLADSSGYAPAGTHDGVIATGTGATPAIGGTPVWAGDVPPQFNGSYSLDLSTVANSFVMISNSASTDLNYWPTFDRSMTNGYTVTVWAEGWPSANYGVFVGKRGETSGSTSAGYQFRRNSSSTQASSVQYGTAKAGVLNSWLLSDSLPAWHHYAFSWDGATGLRKVYIDNILVVSIIGDTGLLVPYPLAHLGLGARQDNLSGNWNNVAGIKLFDVRIYGYALAASDIQAINQEPAAPNPYHLVTGPAPGQGLDLQGNFAISEYYCGTTPNVTNYIGGAAFVNNSNRFTGSGQASANKPNFGSNSDQQNLAAISSQSKTAANMSFTIPTTVGDQYKLQLLFHENFFATAGSRQYVVDVGTNILNVFSNNPAQYALQSMLDMAASGANVTNPVDLVLPYTFTATSTSLLISMTNINNTPMLSALTLADLSTPITAPVLMVGAQNVATNLGSIVNLGVNVSGAGVTYQWQQLLGGVYLNLTDGGNISGSTNNFLKIASLSVTNVGTYRVLASNSAGTVTNGASVSVLTTTVLTSTGSPSYYGAAVVFTATLKTNGLAAGNAIGSYVFAVDGVAVSTNTVNGSGQAAYGTSVLPVASHSVLARYTGDAFYSGSTNSPALTQVVNTDVAPNFTNSSAIRVVGGVPALIGSGLVGMPYRLWFNTNLTTSNWIPLITNTVTVSPFTNLDLGATNDAERFYRFSAP